MCWRQFWRLYNIYVWLFAQKSRNKIKIKVHRKILFDARKSSSAWNLSSSKVSHLENYRWPMMSSFIFKSQFNVAGAGLSSVIISFIMSTYYNVIIAYTLYYFFSSFKSKAPWNGCDNVWNTPDCWMPSRLELNISKPNTSRTPSQEFYE